MTPINLKRSTMGNCLVLDQEKVIKIMKMDGKVLEYRSPLKVHQVLSEFPSYLIADADAPPKSRCLLPDTKLFSGHLYYLIPTTLRSIGVDKKTSMDGQRSVVVRVKLVVSKQELKKMLAKGGVLNGDMASQFEHKKAKDEVVGEEHRGWRPMLESIYEGSDFS